MSFIDLDFATPLQPPSPDLNPSYVHESKFTNIGNNFKFTYSDQDSRAVYEWRLARRLLFDLRVSRVSLRSAHRQMSLRVGLGGAVIE